MQIGRLQRRGSLVGEQSEGPSIGLRKRSHTVPTLFIGNQEDASRIRLSTDRHGHQMTGAWEQILVATQTAPQHSSHLGIVQRKLRPGIAAKSVIEYQEASAAQIQGTPSRVQE